MYSRFTQSTGNPVFRFTVPYYGFYGQDKFQLRKNLTLDFGLREDFQVYPQPKGNHAVPLSNQFPNRYQRLSPRVGFALYVQLQRRVTQGLALMTSYTFSKTMQANGTDFNNQFDFSNTRGPSLLDQRHRLSIAAVYAPNTERLQSAFARTLLSHWAISTVMQFNSGRPYTAILSNNAVNNSAVNEGTGNTSGGLASGSAPSPTQGYNAFYGPWIDEIDLGIARGFHITERHVITFKAQAFNLFNHPNFSLYKMGTESMRPSLIRMGQTAEMERHRFSNAS
ncbi:MAG: hypothetical protein WAR24_08690 [Candidatus Acidiferrales bacterium]